MSSAERATSPTVPARVGVFIDRPKRRVYVFPLPCIGFVISREDPS